VQFAPDSEIHVISPAQTIVPPPKRFVIGFD
jgi:hypothetical protein